MSTPALKARLPEPVIMTKKTDGSLRAFSRAIVNSSSVSELRILSGGRLMLILATPSTMSQSIFLKFMLIQTSP